MFFFFPFYVTKRIQKFMIFYFRCRRLPKLAIIAGRRPPAPGHGGEDSWRRAPTGLTIAQEAKTTVNESWNSNVHFFPYYNCQSNQSNFTATIIIFIIVLGYGVLI